MSRSNVSLSLIKAWAGLYAESEDRSGALFNPLLSQAKPAAGDGDGESCGTEPTVEEDTGGTKSIIVRLCSPYIKNRICYSTKQQGNLKAPCPSDCKAVEDGSHLPCPLPLREKQHSCVQEPVIALLKPKTRSLTGYFVDLHCWRRKLKLRWHHPHASTGIEEPGSECQRGCPDAALADLANVAVCPQDIGQQTPVDESSDHGKEVNSCSTQESIKDEPDSNCDQGGCEEVSADLPNKVEDELPQVMEQPADLTSADHGNDIMENLVSKIVKEVNSCIAEAECVRVKAESDLEIGQETCEVALAALPKKVEDETPRALESEDVASTNHASSCRKVSGESALRQIIAGCSVRLRPLSFLRCDVCGDIYQNKSQLTAHYFDIHVNKELEEPNTATEKTKSYSDILKKWVPGRPYSNNTAKVGNLKLYPCTVCNEIFAFRISMEIHKLTHYDKVPPTCQYCQKLFANHNQLRKHLYSHTTEKLYSCDVCAKTFLSPYLLDNHKNIHTGIKPFSCEFCKKKFSLKIYLKRHRRTHTGEKPYSCGICDRRFSYYSGLKCHQVTHTSDRPVTTKLQCDYCKKLLCGRQTLIKHIEIHTNTKRKLFSCDLCNRNYMRKHKVNHTGSRPHPCSYCSVKFAQKYQLDQHIMDMHTNDTPYTCKFCGNRFVKNHLLNQHLKTHTKPYPCHLCSRSFHNKTFLGKHVRFKHKMP